jgi:polyprenyl P-hydroxybenzoate/phenylacrylic acid decarboxylase-like protein
MKSRQFSGAASEERIVVALASRDDLEHGIGLLRTLLLSGIESHLVVRSDTALALGDELDEVRALATQVYAHENQAARISSGSFLTRGMIVVPCDGASVGAIVMGLATNLVHRAADVTLKEARPLVLGVRPDVLAAVPDDVLERAAAVPGLVLVPLAESVEDSVPALLAQLGSDGALVAA